MNIFKCLSSKNKEDRSKSQNKTNAVPKRPQHLVPPNKIGRTGLDRDEENASNFSSSQASNFNNLHRKGGAKGSDEEDVYNNGGTNSN